MDYREKLQILKQEQEENTCDICGAPNALIRDRKHLGQKVENYWENYWISGFTCQKCIDEGKELDHVNNMLAAKSSEEKEYKFLLDELEKLYRRTNGNPDAEDVKKITNRLDELDKSQKDRDQLERRFMNARNNVIDEFKFEYGPGVEDKYCKICGSDESYPCVVQTICNNNTHNWYHLSGWLCSDCITLGRMDTYIEREFRELLKFMKEWQDIKEKDELFKSIPSKSELPEKEIKSYLSNYIYRKELGRKKARYDRKAEHMMYDTLGYEFFEPVMFVIEPAKVGDPCVFCDEKYGKDFKCGDD